MIMLLYFIISYKHTNSRNNTMKVGSPHDLDFRNENLFETIFRNNLLNYTNMLELFWHNKTRWFTNISPWQWNIKEIMIIVSTLYFDGFSTMWSNCGADAPELRLYCAKPSPWYTQWDISCEPDLSNDLVLLRTIDSHVTMRLAKGLSLLLCRYLEAVQREGFSILDNTHFVCTESS